MKKKILSALALTVIATQLCLSQSTQAQSPPPIEQQLQQAIQAAQQATANAMAQTSAAIEAASQAINNTMPSVSQGMPLQPYDIQSIQQAEQQVQAAMQAAQQAQEMAMQMIQQTKSQQMNQNYRIVSQSRMTIQNNLQTLEQMHKQLQESQAKLQMIRHQAHF